MTKHLVNIEDFNENDGSVYDIKLFVISDNRIKTAYISQIYNNNVFIKVNNSSEPLIDVYILNAEHITLSFLLTRLKRYGNIYTNRMQMITDNRNNFNKRRTEAYYKKYPELFI